MKTLLVALALLISQLAFAVPTQNACMSPGTQIQVAYGTTSGTNATQIIALASGQRIYVCSLNVTGVSGSATPT